VDAASSGCVAEQVERLQAFGNTPRRLSSLIRRSFVVARNFVDGLAVGRDTIATLANVSVYLSTSLLSNPICLIQTASRQCGQGFMCRPICRFCFLSHSFLLLPVPVGENSKVAFKK